MTTRLIQQVYPGMGMEPLLTLTRQRHAACCADHDIAYLPAITTGEAFPTLEHGAWTKVELIKKALADGHDQVIYLDADTIIVDPGADLRDACKGVDVGAVKFYAPKTWRDHFNVGALYFTNGPRAASFVDKWFAMYPENEQAAFNFLAAIEPCVTELDCIWNHTIDRHDEKPGIVVRGFHSVRGTEAKLKAMCEALS